MLRIHTNIQKKLSILFINIILLISYSALILPAEATSSYTGGSKPMQFYFHYLDNPVAVAGLETKYVLNTIKQFSFPTKQDAFTNTFYKPIGLPKIEVDFYLYPNLAGPVTIDGLWQVSIWVNGSAYKPAGFALHFAEITVGGNTLWASGLINPTVLSSVGNYIDVPVYNYNLSTHLNHTFSPGTTLFVGVEINSGSSAETYIFYDSPLYPSKVVLPAKDYARPIEIKTYSYDNTETTLFHYNWSESQRVVIVRATVTDPFGGYDIHRVNMTIFDPAGNVVMKDITMIRKSDGQWETSFSHLFEANYTYASTVQRGNYTVIVTAVDNNGYYQNLEAGDFNPFTEELTHVFSIGVILYFDPAFQMVDDVGDPLPSAQVYVNWPNGTRDTLPWYTSVDGFINFTHVPSAIYEFTVFWKDVLVKQAAVDVNSNGPYVIKTDVYRLSVEVLGNNGDIINGAYVIVYAQSGVGYGLSVSDESGQAVFKLPTGIYDIEAHYSGAYWFSVITATANITDIQVNSSKSATITLAEFPPPIWTTAGFWLLLVPILLVIMIVVSWFVLRHRRPRIKK